jgi:DNA-binding transcriptional ArsR family regulator
MRPVYRTDTSVSAELRRMYLCGVTSAPDLAATAALIGDPSRARMLTALLGGVALPATELARQAGIAPPTASGHLTKLVEGGLIRVVTSGRHRYFSLTGAPVARVLESLALVAPAARPGTLTSSFEARRLQRARTCYDHLAGALGVGLTHALVSRGCLELHDDAFELTASGAEWLEGFGIECEPVRARRRLFARACLDWSERRPHLAGALGAALATRLFDLGWIERIPRSRAVGVTAAGRRGLRRTFDLQP